MEESFYPDVAYYGHVPPMEERACTGCCVKYTSTNTEYCVKCWWKEVGSKPLPMYTGQSRGFASDRIDPRPVILPIDEDPSITAEQRKRLLYVKGGKKIKKGHTKGRKKSGSNGAVKKKPLEIQQVDPLRIEPMDFM